MQIEIRKITLADAPEIASLSAQLGYELATPLIREQIGAISRHPEHAAFTAIYDKKPIAYIHGFLAMRLTSPPFVEIGALVVKTEYRKKGIARKLIDHLITHYENPQSIRVRCNVKRTSAHEFYQALNYTEKKEQKVFERKIPDQ